MLVYRVQTSQGRGPYAGRDMGVYGNQPTIDMQGKFSHDASRHPVEGWEENGPAQSFVRGNGRLRYAFISIDQLRCWFDGFGNKVYLYMKKFSYIVAVYEVDDDFVWLHKAQLTYDMSEATHVRDEELPCM